MPIRWWAIWGGWVGTATIYSAQCWRSKKGIDFVAYARPGAEQPDSVRAWQGVERLGWMNSSRWGMGKRGSSDQLDLYHGTNFKMQTVGRYGGVVTIHDLWLDRHPEYSKKMLGQWPSSFKTRQTALRARKTITVSEFSARELDGGLWFEARAHQSHSQRSVG